MVLGLIRGLGAFVQTQFDAVSVNGEHGSVGLGGLAAE